MGQRCHDDRDDDLAASVRNGGQILRDQLLINKTDLAFCVPGESFLAVIDALRDVEDRLPLMTCRHEASAANMAEAYGKLTGRPGVAFVTRGPGATQASVGVHTAAQDSTPMILFVGLIKRGHRGREAFQEINLASMFQGMAKWATEITETDRIPETVSRAFAVALGGRPGPVVVGLPEDMLSETSVVPDARTAPVARAEPSPGQVASVHQLLASARRPLAIIGGGRWTARASADWAAFASANDLPTVTSFRRQDYLDNASEQYVGVLGLGTDPALVRRVGEADLLLAVGCRLGDITTAGYTLLDVPEPRQRLVHVHPDVGELGRVYRPELAINADTPAFVAHLRSLPPVTAPPWAQWRAEARADYLRFSQPVAWSRGVDLGHVIGCLRQRLPADAVVTNGAGNYTVWVHRYHQYRSFRTQLAPTSGAMGYGIPAAIAAKAADPERTVVAFAGDGCFLMAGSELATAMQYDLPILVVVVNNQMLGTIRMHQERAAPGRPYATSLTNPDFASYARSFGAFGEQVTDNASVAAALDRALTAGRPAVLELLTDPERLTPDASITGIGSAAQGATA